MQLKIYRSLWGMTGPLEEQFSRIAAAGYDGVEAPPQDIIDPAQFKALLAQHKLDFMALVYTEGKDHAAHFEQVIDNAMQYSPTKIVAHAGRDLMSYVKQVRFFVRALRIEERIGIPIAHETHRRRPFFSPMNTRAILQELPELRLNVDFSHWCCVTESMLEDHADTIQIAAEHAVHTHGRVGYENGPQVPDPRAPEWQDRLLQHEAWWDLVIAAHQARKENTFTFTPEYGPPTYMHTMPNINQPVADLWDVCVWSANRFRDQFKKATAK
ncbi:MAG: TIM barrel protein [Candidatus Kapaibacterium sp.]|jgi:sugar phosphate isomerase/epimerase